MSGMVHQELSIRSVREPLPLPPDQCQWYLVTGRRGGGIRISPHPPSMKSQAANCCSHPVNFDILSFLSPCPSLLLMLLSGSPKLQAASSPSAWVPIIRFCSPLPFDQTTLCLRCVAWTQIAQFGGLDNFRVELLPARVALCGCLTFSALKARLVSGAADPWWAYQAEHTGARVENHFSQMYPTVIPLSGGSGTDGNLFHRAGWL